MMGEVMREGVREGDEGVMMEGDDGGYDGG